LIESLVGISTSWVQPGNPSPRSFLNGALTRLLDPDRVLRGKAAEFVEQGDFGLASGPKADGGYEYLWYQQLCPADEVSFEAGVLLLKKDRAANWPL
jgi:hypothetical protein